VPFFDRQGRRLTRGGGTTVYGSNHGVVYAPGGLGVLTGNGSRRDVLYFHYCTFLSDHPVRCLTV
jgi:arabinan endo-1,5-alpha-L-arabinosidase